jgi:N-acetylmuramic acid 6-phosphate etherase
MQKKAQMEAENFLKNETQFHLGMLPTEQSNSKTHNLDKKFAENVSEGARMLLMVDKDVYTMTKKVLGGKEFNDMVEAGIAAISGGRKLVFSGCGATGRLSILLESMWRRFFRDLSGNQPEIYSKIKRYENSVFSIMTGGDYALIRSVEYFEDYQEFGIQQVREMNIAEGDVLVAITEGGETSSVLGTVAESADRGAKIFLLFNNPANILTKYIQRSKTAIEDPRVTVIDLYCGPMALAGSTRMQATTSEQLVAGAALETILTRCIKPFLSQLQLNQLNIKELDYTEEFNSMLDELLTDKNTEVLGDYIKMERDVYLAKGLVTYFADEFLMDIFTDTTERTPTFMLPPFKKHDDISALPSWAFVKYPLLPTPATWIYALGRSPRCLDWDTLLYKKMGASGKIASDPPQLDITQIEKFHIGNEEDDSRISRNPNVAVNVAGSREILSSSNPEYLPAFKKIASKYQHSTTISIGKSREHEGFHISCSLNPSVMNLIEHMAFKLVLNTISTGTMVVMGRVSGNWMTWVDVTNKKLKDRGIRLISEICGLSYNDACYALHESLEELKVINQQNPEKYSPVQYTIQKLTKG